MRRTELLPSALPLEALPPAPRVLLIDFNNVLHAALAVHAHLRSGNELTGGVYGFLTRVTGAIARVQPAAVIACRDTRPYLREQVYPDYKGDRRKRVRDPGFVRAYASNLDRCKELLTVANIPLWELPGCEADDLMALGAEYYAPASVVLLSSDTDLYGLLRLPSVSLWNHKRVWFYTLAQWREAYPGVTPTDWPKLVALMGSHNNVVGIRGIGPKKALAAVQAPATWAALFRAHGPQLTLNESLATLPFAPIREAYPAAALRPPVSRDQLRAGRTAAYCDYRALLTFCNELEINVTSTMQQALCAVPAAPAPRKRLVLRTPAAWRTAV